MSNPYETEAELRADLVDARLKHYHEKIRREQAEAALALFRAENENLKAAIARGIVNGCIKVDNSNWQEPRGVQS